LPDAERQRYIEKFKSLGIDKTRNEFLRSEWTNDSVVLQNGVDNMTIMKLLATAGDVTVTLCRL